MSLAQWPYAHTRLLRLPSHALPVRSSQASPLRDVVGGLRGQLQEKDLQLVQVRGWWWVLGGKWWSCCRNEHLG